LNGILSIVVPAYNEEESVASTLRRCVAASARLTGSGLGVGEVEVILVDDGSRDRTRELACSVEGVRVLGHPGNRGYGAAIKTGFAEARGDLLGFLDADGTCDPEFFAELLRLLRDKDLDVALGSRMHPLSRMPRVRVLGNWMFRTLLNCIAGGGVTDTASGMRLLRRSSLDRLYPLPDGLHFTPAMSVRAVLDPGLRIGEIPMPYAERAGRSKLSVAADGVRFLGAIIETASTYRPAAFFGFCAALLAAASLPFLFLRLGGPCAPVPFYLARGRVEDWMLFRLVLSTVLLGAAGFLAALGAAAQALTDLVNGAPDPFCVRGWKASLLGRFSLLGAACLALGVWINRRPLASYLLTGHIPVPGQGPEFWVFPVVGAMFVLAGIELLGFSALAGISRLLWERERIRRGGKAL
jgi:glycosyltransferase involved in cell wall biosynthesis